MTPQNEVQMNEEFEKWWISIDEDCRWETDKSDHKVPFKSAYSLQQEKIDKLEQIIEKQEISLDDFEITFKGFTGRDGYESANEIYKRYEKARIKVEELKKGLK